MKYSRKDNDRHSHKRSSPLPKGVTLIIRDVAQKAVFFCQSPENYILKVEEFTKNNVRIICSHEIKEVQKMIIV